MTNLTLSSPAFDDGEPIPEKHGYKVENVSPPLSVSGVPDEAESLALVMMDLSSDQPISNTREPVQETLQDHWVVWNIPTDIDIPEGWDPTTDGATEGSNDFGETGYGGPSPPDHEHTYRFILYALNTTLDLSSSAGQARLEDAMEDHVLDETFLEGTYPP